jgi:predicted ATPase
MYGIAELVTGNYERGYRFGKLALKLQAQLKSKETESGTIGSGVALLVHWRDALRPGLPLS